MSSMLLDETTRRRAEDTLTMCHRTGLFTKDYQTEWRFAIALGILPDQLKEVVDRQTLIELEELDYKIEELVQAEESDKKKNIDEGIQKIRDLMDEIHAIEEEMRAEEIRRGKKIKRFIAFSAALVSVGVVAAIASKHLRT